MKVIGIGGAGGKIAAKMDDSAILVNVSRIELEKVEGGGERIIAPVQSTLGQFRGSRKDPEIGHDAYLTIRRRLHEIVVGGMVFSSTGGGTGNGITTGILEGISSFDDELGNQGSTIPVQERTFFCLILPYDGMESAEYVNNSIDFMTGPLADVIDKGCTGNIVLFSNKMKFTEKISEDHYNDMIVNSLKVFMAIPDKNEELKLLESHIDHEDFSAFIAKPFFNHFNYFDYDPSKSFGSQLKANSNPLLLDAEEPIEAMFLLEVPSGQDHTIFYDIVKYFVDCKIPPVYSVVENPDLKKPFVTVSRLYSRKPYELLDDFNKKNLELADAKVQKSLEQHVVLEKLEVNFDKEAKRAGKQKGVGDDVLATLKRIGKL